MAKWLKSAVAILFVAASVTHTDASRNNMNQRPESCNELDFECIKLNLVKNMDAVIKQRSFKLLNGVTLEQSPGTEAVATGRSINDVDVERYLPEDPDKRDDKLDDLLNDRMSRLFGSRSLKISIESLFPGLALRISKNLEGKNGITIELESTDGGRALTKGRIGHLRRFWPILLLFKYKSYFIGIISLLTVAAMAGKALLLSKLSLLFSGLLAVKRFTSLNQQQTQQQDYSNVYSSLGSVGNVAYGTTQQGVVAGYSRSLHGNSEVNRSSSKMAFRSY